MTTPEFFYSIKKFCEHASISRAQFYKYCYAGKGPELFREPEGKKVFIPRENALEWFQENKIGLEHYSLERD